MKGYLQSRTVWGLLVIGVSRLISAAWPESSLDSSQVELILTNVADLIGMGVATYGTVARKDLSGLWRPKSGA